MADENLPYQRALQRRVRRRAQLAVDNRLRIQELRNQLLNYADNNYSESDTSGNVETGSEPDWEESDNDLSDHAMDIDVGNEGAQVDNDVAGNGNNENSSDGSQAEDSVSEEDEDNVAVGGDNEGAAVAERGVDWPEEEKEEYVIQSLREWARSGGVLSRRKVDELLQKLSFVYRKMPLSYKTLLQTAQNIDVLSDGYMKFWYKGIKKNLEQLNLLHYLVVSGGSIDIDINIDGLPLFKDSIYNAKFWPILGRLFHSDDDPFIIALYFGSKDPKDVDMYLGDFVLEVAELRNQGYNYNGVNYPVNMHNFILDAPARSFVKCCIGHGGYGACEKCTVVGAYQEGRMTFAVVGADCRPRTDESYLNQDDRLHHTGHSPLELAGIGMVSQFRLETLHLLYNGAFSRYLDALLTWEGPWNPEDLAGISTKLLSFINSCPRDFNRKPRKLEIWYKFKATELRRLLLYDGIVAFEGKLNDDVMNLFLLLHCAIYIMASPYLLPLFCDVAEGFLCEFVQRSAALFGPHFVTYNVHSMVHLGDECREHGTTESFTAFCFENCLKGIKETLRSGYLPLEQIIKRDSERTEVRDVKLKSNQNTIELHNPHVDIEEEEVGDHFKRICVNDVTLKIHSRDSCFMTTDGSVVVLHNIIQFGENAVMFSGKRFSHSENVYEYPMPSSQLGIVRVTNLQDRRERFPIECVFAKCWLIPDNDTYVAVPLVHSTPLLH